MERSEQVGEIAQGEEVGGAMDRLRTFMFEHVYLGPAVREEQARVVRMLAALLDHYAEHPPSAVVAGASDAERVTDYLAGMTDRYAVRAFAELSLPQVP